MEPQDQIKIPENIQLTRDEREAYQRHLQRSGPPLSPKLSAELFELFLQGQTCEAIAKLNPGLGLGIVVAGRIQFKWDKQKDDYINHLYATIKDKAAKSQLEAIDFSSTAMSVFHKLWYPKFLRFLQTGNEEDLGEFKGMTFKFYKEMSDALLKLTGQDKKQVVSGEVVHKVEMPSNRPIEPKQAADLLKLVDVSKK